MFNQENLEILNTENFKKNLLNKLEISANTEDPNIINDEDFEMILKVENKKRQKDFLLYKIDLTDKTTKDIIVRKILKIIREEDLISCSKKQIKVLFREVKDKEKASKVIGEKLKKILNQNAIVKQF